MLLKNFTVSQSINFINMLKLKSAPKNIGGQEKSFYHDRRLPLLIEKGEDDFYVVECPLFEGCYTQGKTIDEALENIREVIGLILEEKKAREILKYYNPQEVSLHTITI